MMEIMLSVYIYIYIYICIFRQHFFVNANFIKHNRHFMPTYSLLDPFEFSYYFYRIRGELIKVLSIVVCIPSTFCPTLGHHQGRICYKGDVTFVLANYYCVRTSLLLEIMALAFKCNSVNTTMDNTLIREFERIQKRICRHKMSIMFNEIYIYIYIYIYM